MVVIEPLLGHAEVQPLFNLRSLYVVHPPCMHQAPCTCRPCNVHSASRTMCTVHIPEAVSISHFNSETTKTLYH
jgi:hypothetical protein